MAHDIELPEIFPVEEIVVKEEEHEFDVFQGSNEPLPTTEYTLDKAPIKNIRTVTGTLSGARGHEFVNGVDYELSENGEQIVWLDEDRPDAGTSFFVTYRADSILGRYIESASEEFDTIDAAVIDAVQGKFVGQATGSELDEIGKLFGPTIGKRRGRDDTQYRIFLQSVVQSFISRGTKMGIKLAISAATDVPVADITINENFETNQYEVVVIPDTAVRVSVLEEISDIADPSGVSQIRTRFPVFDEMGVNDRGRPTPNKFTAADELSVADVATVPPKAADMIDSLAVDDAATVPPKAADTADTLFADDTAILQPKSTDTTDTMSADDATANAQTNVTWDNGSWDDMNWATEHN